MLINKIIVLDFGSQYSQLIARRIREMGVYSELLPYDISLEKLQSIKNIKGIVLSGGPHSIYENISFNINLLGIPVK